MFSLMIAQLSHSRSDYLDDDKNQIVDKARLAVVVGSHWIEDGEIRLRQRKGPFVPKCGFQSQSNRWLAFSCVYLFANRFHRLSIKRWSSLKDIGEVLCFYLRRGNKDAIGRKSETNRYAMIIGNFIDKLNRSMRYFQYFPMYVCLTTEYPMITAYLD